MSAIVLSSAEGFVGLSKKLEKLEIDNIHFYNSKSHGNAGTPVIAIVPFVDFVILGKDADVSPHLTKVVDEAFARHIPVIYEECLGGMEYCVY